MSKRIVSTAAAPAAIGPYSQAVRAGRFVFASGQIPMHPESGEIVGTDAATQAEQVLRNLQAVLEGGGAGLRDVVKATVYLADMNDFNTVNEVYARFFDEDPPARVAIEVSRLPRDVIVEIDAIAYTDEA